MSTAAGPVRRSGAPAGDRSAGADGTEGADAARVARFRELLRVPTVSRPERHLVDGAAFAEFRALLPRLYPRLHAALEREVVDGTALLYRWPGAGGADPTVLMAHFDVVPAADDRWQHPPFAAHLDSGPLRGARLHGRGTLDDKGALAAILEAVEDLVGAGFTPASDVYLAFGADEEVAGTGAGRIAALLEARGVRAGLVLDEGGAVVEPGVVRGVRRPLAVVGVTEKGITSLQLVVEQQGGHASTPPRLTAPARLARAVTRLSRSPFPARLNPAAEAFVRTIAEAATGPQRLLFRHVRWTRPLVTRLFAALSDETRAMVRTTAAVTQLSGSDGANVLAERASATVDVRIAVGSSVADAVAHVRRAVRDPAVRVEVLHPSEPSPVSPSSGRAWDDLVAAIGAIHPYALVTPYTMLGASDSRHFTRISDAVYRFTPFEMSAAERATLHARDESIGVGTWLDGIDVFRLLLRRR